MNELKDIFRISGNLSDMIDYPHGYQGVRVKSYLNKLCLRNKLNQKIRSFYV